MDPTKRRPSGVPPFLAPLALAVVLAGTFAAVPAAAQNAALVADLNFESDFTTPDSRPADLVSFGGKVFFTAFAPASGREPWVSDGTAAGTEMLGDLCPGSCDSQARPLGAVGGRLLFVARDAEDRSDLRIWRTDGTRRGTVAVEVGGEALSPPYDDGDPGAVFLGGRLFFHACTASTGCELWASDGTPGGTRLVQDVAPGSGDAQIDSLVPLAGKVYFFARPDFPSELWAARADGTGASRVIELGFDPRFLTPSGGKLYFVAEVQGRGDELWASDGTAAGTRPVSDFAAPSPFEPTGALRALGGRIYFVADDILHGEEIWTSDGTAAGTRRVTEFGFAQAFTAGGGGEGAPPMALLGGKLLFFATDGISPRKLWRSTGTPETTAVVADVQVSGGQLLPVRDKVLFRGRDAVGNLQLFASDGLAAGTLSLTEGCRCEVFGDDLVPLGDAAFFRARGAVATSLWRTDGTRAGTRRFSESVADLDTSSLSLAALGAEVFFAAGGDYGEELWASNGTPGATRLVADLVSNNPSSLPGRLTMRGDGLLFAACDESDRQVWFTAGSAESTGKVSIGGNSYCDVHQDRMAFAATAGAFYFLREDGSYGPQLWKTDGTPAGTVKLTNFDNFESIDELVAVGSRVYFPREDDTVWTSDGTAAGTRQAFFVPAGGHAVHGLAAVGPHLYFLAFGADNELGVWASDGSQSGTRKLLDVADGSSNPDFTLAGGNAFFVADDGNSEDGPQLFRSDGTPGGTEPVPGAGGVRYSQPRDLVAFAGTLFFFARNSEGDFGLWKVGPGGAALVRAFPFDGFFGRQEPAEPTVLGGRLLFAVADTEHGRELWASDGTAAGTALVRELIPGPGGSQISGLAVAGGRLYFTAHDGVHGIELWQSDGTAAGTRLAQDIAPGARSSSPQDLTAATGHLYFSADDGLHGRELWALPLGGSGGCQPTSTRLCLGNGRFAVDAEWRDFQGNRGAGHGVAVTADTGTLWFFQPENVEVMIKVLDARALNEHFWVFFGALSSVEYNLTVTDTQTGLSRRYYNPSGQLASVADTHGFGPLGAYATAAGIAGVAAPPPAPRRVFAHTEPAAATGICQPTATRLCLQGGRFAVEATWKDFQGHTGTGQAVPLTADTGTFWFFNQANLEVVVKVLDGRPLNGKFWLFYGALSNVEYTLTVTDTQTGAVRPYPNPAGRLASVADTGAF